MTASSVAVGIVSPIGVSGVVQAAPYEPLDSPQRIVDSRPGGETVDGTLEKIDRLAADSTLTIQIGGRAGVPAKATSVVLNVTAASPTEGGFFTVFPCGDRPNSSNLNYRTGQNIANTVFATLDESGQACLYTSGNTHLIVDVAGTMPEDAFAGLVPPRRFADTRSGGGQTFDELIEGTGPQPAGSTLTIPVAGRSGVPVDAATVVLNVTAVRPETNGFFTVFPCGDVPTASNLNYRAGQAIANAVVAGISAGGDVCVFTSAASDVVVDVAGTLATDTYVPLAEPQRIADTRLTGQTVDGFWSEIGMRNGGETLVLPVADRGDVPAGATGVILNVTAVQAQDRGFVTVHPRGSERPNASNLNFDSGRNIANAVVARVGGDGLVCIYNSSATHLIIDVAGYLVGPDSGLGGEGCPPNEQRLDSSITSEPGFVALIPEDLQPGRYEMPSAPETCGFGRYEQPFVSGADTPVVGSSGAAGPGTRLIVDIRPTDIEFGYSSSCPNIRPYQPSSSPATSFGAGMYVVDQDIAIGSYSTTASDGCLVFVLESFDGSFGSVLGFIEVTDENAGEQFLSLTPATAGVFTTPECGTWTPAELKSGVSPTSSVTAPSEVSMPPAPDTLWS